MTSVVRTIHGIKDRRKGAGSFFHCPVRALLLLLFVIVEYFTCTPSATASAMVQPESDNPTSSRDVRKYRGSDLGAKLTGCITDLPATGGVCDARGLTVDLALSSDLVINKPYTTIYLPQGVIQMGQHSILIKPGTHGTSIVATAMHGRFIVMGQTRLRYTGRG